ncbi:MAG: hypothetical protein AAFX87_19345 [Bacteroidota bacterium]
MVRLRPDLRKKTRSDYNLAVIPNDVAYPLSLVVKYLKRRGKKLVLFQEGIRFPLPNEEGQINYGNSGVDHLFSWGEKSATYFRQHIQKNTKVEVLGNPRFDKMISKDYHEHLVDIKRENDLGDLNILYASNPVDDQGFCSLSEKLNLFRQTIESLKPFRKEANLKLWYRLHPREDSNDFNDVIRESEAQEWVKPLQTPPLFPVVRSMDFVIVLASTVGLESLMNDVPIGVLKIPRYNFVFDYVDQEVAIGLNPQDDDLYRKIITWIKDFHLKKHKEYVNSHVANLGKSTELISSRLKEVYGN